MNRRIAKKVHKRWKEAVDQDGRIRTFHHEIGPEGKAQREMLAQMFKSPLEPSQYESGWWPIGRLIHHLRIKKRSHYSQRQVQRAYYKRPIEERMEWQIDIRLIQAQRDRERIRQEKGDWGHDLWMPSAMSAFARHYVGEVA